MNANQTLSNLRILVVCLSRFLSTTAHLLIFGFCFVPKSVAGEVDENIFERRFAERDGFRTIGKRLDEARDPLVAVRLFEPHGTIDDHRRHVEPLLNFAGKPRGILAANCNCIASDRRLQRARRIERRKLPFVHDRNAVGPLSFIQ